MSAHVSQQTKVGFDNHAQGLVVPLHNAASHVNRHFGNSQKLNFISKVSFQLRFLNFKVKVYLYIEIFRQTGLIKN